MTTHNEKGFSLTYNQGKQVQEILRRYVREELRPQIRYVNDPDTEHEINKDISYIKELAELFETGEDV